MTVRLFPLVLKFVAITAPLTWLWLEWGREAYYRFFVQVSRPLLLVLGVTGVRRDLVYDRFINYLPFLALMLITPALSLQRRLVGSLVGCFVLYLGHLALTVVAFESFIKHGTNAESMANLFPAWILSDALPFVLWALIANDLLRQGLGQLFESKGSSPKQGEG